MTRDERMRASTTRPTSASRSAESSTATPRLPAPSATCFPVDVMREFMRRPEIDPKDYVHEYADQLATLEAALQTFLKKKLSGFTSTLYVDLLTLTESWNEQRKWALLNRYLGFQFWDVLLYPLQALGDVGERDNVEIVRLSPRDANRIPSAEPN